MKSKKILAGLLTAALTLSSVTALASSSDITDTQYYTAASSGTATYSDKESEVTASLPTEVKAKDNYGTYILKESNGNIYKSIVRYAQGTSEAWNASYIGADVSITDWGTSGEYILQEKIRFSSPWSGTAHVLYYMQSDTLSGYQNGFRFNSVNAGDSSADTIQFVAGGTASNIGSYAFQAGVWYTVRQTYNFDLKKATLEIYNADATTSLYSVSVNLAQYETSTVIFSGLKGAGSKRIDIGPEVKSVDLDDTVAVKTAKKPVTVTVGEHGKVQYNSNDVVSGAETPVTYNADATFTIVPDSNYEVDTVKVNDTPVAVTDNTVTLASVKEAQKMSVTFKQAESTAPSVVTSGTSYVFTSDYKDGNGAQVAYFTVNPGSGYTFTKGIAKLTTSSGETLTLESDDMLTYANAEGWNGRYGVRIYGDGLTDGESYTLAPYWEATKGDDTVTIDPSSNDSEKAGYTFTFGQNK